MTERITLKTNWRKLYESVSKDIADYRERNKALEAEITKLERLNITVRKERDDLIKRFEEAQKVKNHLFRKNKALSRGMHHVARALEEVTNEMYELEEKQ